MQPPIPRSPTGDRSVVLQRRRRHRSIPLPSLTWKGLAAVATTGLIGLAVFQGFFQHAGRSPFQTRHWNGEPVPLAMEEGDPYIRALMRTISASESSDPRPYTLLYGGSHADDLRAHPDECIPIVAGPNVGKCTTAAGRYQFLTTTWLEMAAAYHPAPKGFAFWRSYSFEPEYQDAVVHAWLNDPNAWGVDIAAKLRDQELSDVLWLLSGTWTSLGYGIETNVMSRYLPEIYWEMLDQELAQMGQ
jgi:muramidase (phage lysozyme)